MQEKTLQRIYAIFRENGKISTDSRRITPGAIFFALKGENFDGNSYAAKALEAGALCCVVDNPAAAPDERYILVEDTLAALQELARHHRRELGIPVLAITGSNGKTTTKELVGRVLARRFRIAMTQGNLNNHIGVPLTLLSIDNAVEFAIVEMGASHQGEIASYCAIAEPDYGLITNIGKAHLEGFGGLEGIKKGKGELFDYLLANRGTAFYLKESAELSNMVDGRPGLSSCAYSTEDVQVVMPGESPLRLQYGQYGITTHLIGDYNRNNVSAALLMARYFGIDPAEAVEAIESYIPDNYRSQRKTTERNILYLDAYNANPTSMLAAIENFSKSLEASHNPVLILGDMRELGVYAEEEHRKILQQIEKSGFKNVYLVGEIFERINGNPAFATFKDVDGLNTCLRERPIEKSVILVKGSRGIGLEKTEEFL